jgi:hypothetical protein
MPRGLAGQRRGLSESCLRTGDRCSVGREVGRTYQGMHRGSLQCYRSGVAGGARSRWGSELREISKDSIV